MHVKSRSSAAFCRSVIVRSSASRCRLASNWAIYWRPPIARAAVAICFWCIELSIWVLACGKTWRNKKNQIISSHSNSFGITFQLLRPRVFLAFLGGGSWCSHCFSFASIMGFKLLPFRSSKQSSKTISTLIKILEVKWISAKRRSPSAFLSLFLATK